MKLLAKLRKSKTTPVLAPAAPAATLQDPKPLEAKERPHIYRLVDILQAQGSPMTLKELTSAYGQAYGEDIENIQNFRTILGLNLLGSGTLSNGNQLCAGRWECIARAVPQVFDVVSNGQEQRIEAKPNARCKFCG
ncbi:hypothetical protein AAVH_16061 [Aphelenchoides avenae]|nr:hypothetical protein AAVH_16061 [Aphelenchus avenae]